MCRSWLESVVGGVVSEVMVETEDYFGIPYGATGPFGKETTRLKPREGKPSVIFQTHNKSMSGWTRGYRSTKGWHDEPVREQSRMGGSNQLASTSRDSGSDQQSAHVAYGPPSAGPGGKVVARA